MGGGEKKWTIKVMEYMEDVMEATMRKRHKQLQTQGTLL